MTGQSIEAAVLNDRVKEVPTAKTDNQLSAGSLDLLKQGQSQPKPTDTASSVLPEVTFAAGGTAGRFSPRFSDSSNPNIAMGNPSNATADASNGDNYLISRDQYVMSYNKDHKTPNWVSWQLDTDWLGPEQRSGQFIPDTSLPAGFDPAVTGEYTKSGYDRGHNCPSGDRTATHEDNEATFLMSNIAPQAPDNNRGPWENLESYSRQLAKEGKELYIIAGNEGSKGTIGNGVNVPETWFKVIVVLPQKGMGAADVNSQTEVIAVEMPNTNGIKGDDWRKYATTVSAIERHTGYHFMTNVPRDVEQTLASKPYDGK